MTPTQRIILNTAVSYGRSLFAMALGLFSSRWVLEALGQDDFGLFSLVGSVIVFITFLNGVMSSSVSRHYAYAIGQSTHYETRQQKVDAVKKWFNTALSIHLILPALLILIGYPIGAWCIQHYFVIDAARINACLWVFRFSLIAAYISMASVPFIALYTAKQLIAELSIVGFFSALLTFGCAYSLLHVSSDRLIAYAFYMMAISAGIPLIQCLRARLAFPECRLDFSHWFDRKRFSQLTSFAGWQLFGGIGSILRNQGSAILLNRYFGTKVNAAYGISSAIMGQTQTLSSSLIGAFTPALTVIEGSGNREHMIDMAFRMCKFGVFLILVFAIPLMLEINEVLRLWLKTPPFYTAELCLCMIIVLVFDKATIGHMTAITACGKVALYQAFLGTNLMLTFPVAWMFLRYNVGVLAIGYAFCLMAGTALFGRLFFAKYLIGMSIVRWGRTVFFPLVFVGTPVFLLGVGVKYFYPPSPIRVCFISFICFSVLLSLGWFFVLDKKERIFFISNLTRLRRKKTEFDCMKPILPDNETCCGCSVCVAVCPTQAISMLPDVEGFLQPIVEENKCVLCHLCETTCPVLGTHISSEFVRGGGHLVKAKDDTLRLQSSSGGVFSLLARNILEQEGVVYGAGWERSTMRVVHARATNEDQLSALRGSKYVQSDVGEAYTSVKKDLDAGLHVLFSGCPCQIAGLRTFLKKQYKNLLLVDFICHGVASPGIFALFLKSLSKEKKISDFIFRYKPKAWKSFHTLIRFGDGSSSLSPWTSTLFGRGWACGWFIRRSCFQCQVKGFSSGADLTLSDAWGIEHFAKDFEDEKGISCVYALNSHGTNFLEKILKNTSSICVPFEKAVSFQPSAFHSKQSDPVCGFSWKKRNRLRKKMLEGQVTLDQTMTVLVHRSVFDKLKTRLYRFWGMAVKKGKM